MDADPLQIGDVLKDQKRFVVPVYQRTYAWTPEKQIEAFFDQVEAKTEARLAGEEDSFPHYMGALLVIPRGKFAFNKIQILDVVDGQQRLSTFQILLAALRDLARMHEETTVAEGIEPLLLNLNERGMQDPRTERYKLHPTAYDRPLFRDLIDHRRDALRAKYGEHFYKNGKIKPSGVPLPLRAFWCFWERAEAFITTDGPDAMMDRLMAMSSALLEDFRVIVITLNEKDDAQVIFETLNSGGEPLAAMDLVRNDVFHRALRQEEDIDELMDARWHAFEEPFWKQEASQGRLKKPRIDFFLAHTLAAETGKETLLAELYARYKSFVKERDFPSVDTELETLLRHAPTYRALIEPARDGALAKLARRLEVFDVSTAFPLVFVVQASDAADEDKAAIFELIASYVIRRALCGMTPKNYNNTFVRIAMRLRARGVRYAEAAEALGELQGETVRCPSDDDLRSALLQLPQYGKILKPRLRHILGELEQASRDKFDEAVGLREDLTIEHVLPETWWEHWQLPDGSMAAADLTTGVNEERRRLIDERQSLIHTLGNLTLLTTAGNPHQSNFAFDKKRSLLRGSLLKMNQDIADEPCWDEDAIRRRAGRLGDLAAKIWPAPATAL